MNNLGGFLERFRSLLVSSKQRKEVVIKVIQSAASITLQETDIDIKDATLFIKTHPIVRNEIFMRKGRILEELRPVLGGTEIRDIR